MEKDFHYHVTYALAKLTGQDRPDIIAYASQFVDDNNEGQFSVDGKMVPFPEKIGGSGHGNYYPIMTQSLSPKSLDCMVQKYVYVPFHFLPGDNTVVINRKRNKLNTTPNSANARTIVADAVKSGDPYRMGIALHTFADTWSHQNFTGLREEWNSVYPWYNVFKSMAPNIGHAEAGHSPDMISDDWTDHRTGQRVSNRDRALEAAVESYKILRGASGKGQTLTDVKKDLKKIINADSYDKRIRLAADVLKSRRLGGIPPYDENAWIDEALQRKNRHMVMRKDFEKTHYYRFHQAAKTQFSLTLSLIKEL